jgi:transposase
MVLMNFAENRLSELADALRDARVERRIIALRLVAAGNQAQEVGQAVSVDERTVRVWVKEWNRRGGESLRYDRYKGATPRLPPELESEVKDAIRRGPPEAMGLSVWRGWAIGAWLEKEYAVTYSRDGVYKLLHRLGFSSLMPRPRHPGSDAVAQEEFKKKSCRRPIRPSGARRRESGWMSGSRTRPVSDSRER